MRFKTRHSLTFRLTLLFATASTVVLLALGYLIGDSVEKHFEELDVEQLTGKLDLTRNLLSKIHARNDLSVLPQQLNDSLVGHPGLGVSIFDLDGKLLFTTGDIGYPQSLLDTSRGIKTSGVAQWKQGDQTFRGLSARVPSNVSELSSALVVVSMDSSQHHHFMAGFGITLWWFVAIAALLMGLLGWVSARRGLAPLREMKQNVAEVSANRLHQRISAEKFPSELADLSETFNGMLARLENSFNRLSDFSSDIAHELRTPVSNLMTQTQVTLSKVRSANAYREILVSNAEELDRMARMIADMLFLAKSDNGLLVPRAEPVFLAKEFQELFEFYEALSDEKSIKLSIEGNAEIQGDKLMLRRAFSNLLSNAIRHTPPGREVSVAITHSNNKTALIEVCNPGDIPKEHLQRLFDRFYRVDPSRKRDSEGTGLGLSITKSIIEAHCGSIQAESGNGVVRLIVFIPEVTSKT